MLTETTPSVGRARGSFGQSGGGQSRTSMQWAGASASPQIRAAAHSEVNATAGDAMENKRNLLFGLPCPVPVRCVAGLCGWAVGWAVRHRGVENGGPRGFPIFCLSSRSRRSRVPRILFCRALSGRMSDRPGASLNACPELPRGRTEACDVQCGAPGWPTGRGRKAMGDAAVTACGVKQSFGVCGETLHNCGAGGGGGGTAEQCAAHGACGMGRVPCLGRGHPRRQGGPPNNPPNKRVRGHCSHLAPQQLGRTNRRKKSPTSAEVGRRFGGGEGGVIAFSTAPTHQLLGSANAETTPARAPAAAADRTQRPDATCEGKNG